MTTTPARITGSPLTWAAYLGMSWTWCIGMFFPILLINDLGLFSYIVFAVPNVIGAAAMGYVLRTREASASLVANHRTACVAFSIVTIAFQLFFMLWWLDHTAAPITPNTSPLLITLLILLPITLASLPSLRTYAHNRHAVLIWLISISAAVIMLITSTSGDQPARQLTDIAAPTTPNLLYLVPITVFGFALCPYLDLTFHRARQSVSDAAGPRTFTLGFVGFFFPMILITLVYARVLLPEPTLAFNAFWVAMTAHVLAQLSFTIRVHTTELARSRPITARTLSYAALTLVVVLALLNILSPHSPTNIISSITANHFDTIYRAFMGCYGLFFPAYVWIVILPPHHPSSPHSAPQRTRLIVYAIACLIAVPMFWQGFINQHWFWLAPGILPPLIAPLLLKRRPTSAA